jgi:hypothetical protein
MRKERRLRRNRARKDRTSRSWMFLMASGVYRLSRLSSWRWKQRVRVLSGHKMVLSSDTAPSVGFRPRTVDLEARIVDEWYNHVLYARTLCKLITISMLTLRNKTKAVSATRHR